jgi:hypothetical protein
VLIAPGQMQSNKKERRLSGQALSRPRIRADLALFSSSLRSPWSMLVDQPVDFMVDTGTEQMVVVVIQR